MPGHAPGGSHDGSGLRLIFFPVDEGKLGHWTFLGFSSNRLDENGSHQTVFTRVGLDHSGQRPTTGKVVFGSVNDYISSLQVGLDLLPLGPGLEGVEIFPGPSGPEVLDHSLVLVPSL